MGKEKILLIAFQFCPKGQIGTRRWSKFAKYLANDGHSVHVISAAYSYRDQVNWCHEVEDNDRIKIHRITAGVPGYVLQPERTFGVKLLDRILSKTWYWQDYSQRWKRHLLRFAPRLIKQEKIHKVIVTGGPFAAVYAAALLKQQLPNIELSVDFRDPWSPWASGEGAFYEWRRRRILKQEAFTVQQADQLIFTTERFCQEYKDLYPNAATKMVSLYNGFDRDDFKNIEVYTSSTFDFVYTGSMVAERLEALVALVTAAFRMPDDEIRDALRISVYGARYSAPSFTDPALAQYYEQVVTYQGVLSQKEIFSAINRYQFCLSINAKVHPNLIGAKTFDYMGLKKPIFLISPPGDLADIMVQKKQFWADYNDNSIQSTLRSMYHFYKNRDVDGAQPDYEAYSYDFLTQRLQELIAV